MNDDLSFCFTLSTFSASILSSVHSILEVLPKDMLISLLLLSYAALLVVLVFRHRTKGCAPFNLWLLQIPAWVPHSLACIAFITLLLLHPPC